MPKTHQLPFITKAFRSVPWIGGKWAIVCWEETTWLTEEPLSDDCAPIWIDGELMEFETAREASIETWALNRLIGAIKKGLDS